jgi:hypothetical protein
MALQTEFTTNDHNNNQVTNVPRRTATMNAAIQLVNQSTVDNDAYESQFDKPFNNVSVFELAPEQRLRRAMSYISQLEAEVRTLRDELARTERAVAHNESLLRNALVREQELRAEMFKEKEMC